MQLLVLGGTGWLGNALASNAVASGHSVTCVARGESGALPAGAVWLKADRDQPDALAPLTGKSWDAVIDVSRQPGQVRRAAQALRGHAGLYVFVSSCSVYAVHDTPDEDERAALLAPLTGEVMPDMSVYGEAKVACEHHVLDAFGSERALIARVGLIGGPGDATGRSGYWPWRMSRAAAQQAPVLVPHAPALGTQLIDVRDLANWLIEAACFGTHGTFNVSGPTLTLAGHLAVAQQVAGHTGPLVHATPPWLMAQGVAPWMGPRSLPLWLPLPDYAGFCTRRRDAALAAGLITRPLADTLADTLQWELAQDPLRARKAGLTDTDEHSLLAALAQTADSAEMQ